MITGLRDEGNKARDALEPVGSGFVVLSFVSRYASDMGLLRHSTTGLMSSLGVYASAAGRM